MPQLETKREEGSKNLFNVKQTISLQKMDAELYKEYQKATKALNDIKNEITRKLLGTPEYKFMEGVKAHNRDVVITFSYSSIELKAQIFDFTPPEQEGVRTIDPRVLNQLIGGKLLNDAEKRDLLKSQGIMEAK